MQPTNLYEYYTSKGQALPSVEARAPLAIKAGITGAYTGTAEQNTQLLSYLQGNPTTNTGTVATSVKETPTYIPPTTVVNNTTPTSVLDLTSGISGLQKQQADLLKAQNDRLIASNAEEVAAKKAEADALKGKADYLATRTSESSLLSSTRASMGIDTGLATINSMLPEITSLRDQLNNLNTEKQNAIDNLTGQGRGIPISVLNNQQARIERDYAVRMNSVSSQLASKSATMEALRGNITLADTLAKEAVNAYLYDTEQKVKDYEDLFTYNKEIISNLDTEQKAILDKQYKAITDELATKRDEQTKVAELMVKYPSANISIGDTPTTASEKVNATGGSSIYTKTQITNGSNNAGLTIDEFKKLDPDLQNFFISNPDTFVKQVLTAITDPISTGQKNYTDIQTEIMGLGLTSPVQQWLLQKAKDAQTTYDAKPKPASWWSNVKSFFGL